MKRQKQAIDELDRVILCQLQVDGTLTSQALAGKLNRPASTIRRRVANLVKSDVLRIVGTVNPYAIDYDGWAVIGINSKPGKSWEIAKEIAEYDAVYTVALSLGRYDVMAFAAFDSVRNLMAFVNSKLPKIDGIVSVETSVLSHPRKNFSTIWDIPPE